MLHVVVSDYTFTNLDPERDCARKFDASFAAYQCTSEVESIKALTKADLAFVQLAPIPPQAVAAMNRNAVIVRYGVGVDNLPLPACDQHGVRVCNVPDYGMNEVADHASALLLALHRRLPQLDTQIRGGKWDAVALCGKTVAGLDDTTLGVLGCGRIGRELIKRLSAFGVRCIAHDPVLNPETIRQANAEPVSLEQLWQQSDFISLHTPAVPSTRNIINSASITKMRDGVIIVNCARGELINEEDLAEAINTGKVAGAGLDVFATEPLPANSPLRQLDNVLLSPHAAWSSASSTPRLQRLAAEEGIRALGGKPLRCQINTASQKSDAGSSV